MKLYNGNFLDIIKDIPDKSIDLVVTDPPYKIVQGGCTNYKTAFLKGGSTHEDAKTGKFFKHNDIKFSEWVPEVYRVLKDDTHCYIMCNDRNLRELLNVCHEAKFQLLNILVWQKNNATPNRYYLKNGEFIVFLRKGKAKNINNMGSKSIMQINNVRNKVHPTEKPIELMELLVTNSSNEGDTVLDPFMGSGSTGVACKNTNRHFIGTELDEQYFNIAKGRIE